MNKIILSVFIFLVSTISVFQLSADGKYKEVVIKTVIYCDHCSECSDCEPKIELAVNALKGIKSTELNVEMQTVKVVYNPEKTDEQTIRNAIVNAGFAADEMEPNPQAYARLDACCKKK